MPIESIADHQKLFGRYQHTVHKKNNITSILTRTQRAQGGYIPEGIRLHQLAQAVSAAHKSKMSITHPPIAAKASSLLFFITMITAVKVPEQRRLAQNLFSLSIGLNESQSPGALNRVMSQLPPNVSTLSDNHERSKRSAGCTCEPQEDGSKRKQAKEKRIPEKRSQEKRAKAKAKARARAELRATLRSGSTLSTTNLLTSSAGTVSTSVKLLGYSAGTVGVAVLSSIPFLSTADKGSGAVGGEIPQAPVEKDIGTAEVVVQNSGIQAVQRQQNQEGVNARLNNEINNMESDSINNNRMATNPPHQVVDVSNIPMLTQFIHPMNYYKWLFRHEKTDQLALLQQQIKHHYKTDDVYIYQFGDSENSIPSRFYYLKNNIFALKEEINKAHKLVDGALHKFKHTTMKNDFGVLQYPPNNPIKHYLKGALGTQDESIVHQAMARLEYYLTEISHFFEHYKDNIIFATSKRTGVLYVNNPESPTGFVMPMDSGNRIVIMADIFDNDMVLNNRLHITAIHEASHIQAGSRDFVYSPVTRLVGDASEILEVFDEALYTNGNEAIACDELFIQCYENFLDINIRPEQFIQQIRNDPMLQRNIMMDNADSIAQYIADIAQSRVYNHDYRHHQRHERSLDQKKSAILLTTLLKLFVKHGGLA